MNQLKYFWSLILGLPFLPLLYFQAKKIRRTMPDLVAPEDTIKEESKEAINILSIGESSIASIGVTTHKFGLTGYLAKYIEESYNKTVAYEIVAKSGYTVSKVNQELLQYVQSKKVSLIVIGLGANDSFELIQPKHWKGQISGMITNLQKKFKGIPIVFINMPPITEFPIFTKLLKYFGNRQVRLLANELQSIIPKFDNVHFIAKDLTKIGLIAKYQLGRTDTNDFYSDGVHPSKLTYRLWAREIFDYIQENKIQLNESNRF